MQQIVPGVGNLRLKAAYQLVFALRSGIKPRAFYLRDEKALYGRYWGCLAEFDRLHFETCFYQGVGNLRLKAAYQLVFALRSGIKPRQAVLNRKIHFARLQQQPAAMAFYLRDEKALYGRYWGCLAEFDRALRSGIKPRQAVLNRKIHSLIKTGFEVQPIELRLRLSTA
jgi:predicted N-acyltransferase